MRSLFGRSIYESIDEAFAPHHTALIIIDMQNDFCHPSGTWPAQLGVDITLIQRAIEPIRTLLDQARSREIQVIYTRHTLLKNFKSVSPAHHWWRPYASQRAWPDDFAYAVEGTWGHAVIDQLAPEANDLIVDKHRASAFVDTNLGVLLRSNQIESVVITGCITNGCVIGTAQHAGFFDYYVGVVPECVGTWDAHLHEPALEMMATSSFKEIEGAWAALGR